MRRFSFMLLVTFVFCAALPTFAQDEDAESVVMNALEQLAELPGYHFEYILRTSTAFSDANEVALSTYTRTTAEGSALANGDNFTSFILATGESEAAAEANPRLRVDRTVLNGETFLNFRIEDTAYEDLLYIQPGWQAYEDLLTAASSLPDQTIINNINSMVLPNALFEHPDLITSITELEPESVEGVELRVFDLELDALALVIRRTAPSNSDLQRTLQDVRLIAASTLSASYRLWIGMEDGQLYRATLEETSSIPYLTAEIDDAPPYDIATSTTVDLSISEHGETAEIEPVVFSS